MARFRSARQKRLKVGIEGAEKVAKMLAELEEAASGILEQAAEAGGKVALEDAKRRCPVQTGALKASLHLEKGKTKKPEIKQEVKLSPGKEAYYGTFVELGTSKLAAQPYLRPAIDENHGEISKAINQEVLRAIGRIK